MRHPSGSVATLAARAACVRRREVRMPAGCGAHAAVRAAAMGRGATGRALPRVRSQPRATVRAAFSASRVVRAASRAAAAKSAPLPAYSTARDELTTIGPSARQPARTVADVRHQPLQLRLGALRREVGDLRLEGAHQVVRRIDDGGAEIEDARRIAAPRRREPGRLGVEADAQHRIAGLRRAAQAADEVFAAHLAQVARARARLSPVAAPARRRRRCSWPASAPPAAASRARAGRASG